MKISPARVAAFEILLRIEGYNAYSSILLPKYESDLGEKDRALCHNLVLGVLRRKLYLDAVIAQLSAGKKLDLEVAIALRIGLFQILFLDKIPDYSAVTESVNLVQRARKTSAKSFVNALLRRASSERIELSFEDDLEKISIETSHPRWLIKKWIDQFGIEAATAIAQADNEIPTQAFRITAKGKRNGIKVGESARKSEFVEGCYVTDAANAELRRRAESGDLYFQNEASQIVAAAVEIPLGGKFLDVCAAPGSKTTMIADRYSSPIIGGDVHQSRVRLLRQNCDLQGVANVNIALYDAQNALPFADKGFGSVLVDAPCSGTGTIRNNPEIRYFVRPEDFDELHRKQLAILVEASKTVERGGELVYSTCSLEREENEEVITSFLRSNEEFQAEPPDVDERFLTREGFARTFPHRDGMDGFFIAKLRRAETRV